MRQVRAREWETRANCTGAHIASDLQLIGELWNDAIKSLFLLAGCRLAVNQLLPEHTFDFVGDKFKLILTIAIKREIQAEAEETLFPNLKFVSHFLGVEDSGLFGWVAHASFFGVDLQAGFQLGHLFPEVI